MQLQIKRAILVSTAGILLTVGLALFPTARFVGDILTGFQIDWLSESAANQKLPTDHTRGDAIWALVVSNSGGEWPSSYDHVSLSQGTFWQAIEIVHNANGGTKKHVVHHHRSGWPFHVLKGTVYSSTLASGTLDSVELKIKRSDGTAYVRVPLGIIWLGLFLNSCIYIVAIMLMMFVYSRTLRLLRMRKGLCPVCKYDVRFGNTCSECGWKR